ncbi:hypothetical protein INR49_008520 [Caranx melampygus]|nr:hypothetical protein INR49_008520 [Caranx melampygus]
MEATQSVCPQCKCAVRRNKCFYGWFEAKRPALDGLPLPASYTHAVALQEHKLCFPSHFRTFTIHGHFYRDILRCGRRIGICFGAVSACCFHGNAFLLCA